MSKNKDLGISLVLAVVFVSVVCGLGIPLVAAYPHKEKVVVSSVPGVMIVRARVYCQYTDGAFIEDTYDVSGSYTYVPWPHVLWDWSNENGYGLHLCYSEQYGKCQQWPGGQWHTRTSYAEITV